MFFFFFKREGTLGLCHSLWVAEMYIREERERERERERETLCKWQRERERDFLRCAERERESVCVGGGRERERVSLIHMCRSPQKERDRKGWDQHLVTTKRNEETKDENEQKEWIQLRDKQYMRVTA